MTAPLMCPECGTRWMRSAGWDCSVGTAVDVDVKPLQMVESEGFETCWTA